MSAANWGQLGLLVITLAVICPLLGRYLAAVFGDGPAPGDRWLGRIERRVLRWCRVDPDAEQHWKAYAASVLAFSATAIVALYGLQRLQGLLPLNPDDQSAVGAATAWNTAVSFVTNTNWQSYAGESTMSHLTQMAGLAVQNFVSAAAGIAVAVALVRGLVRSRSNTIGNFWVDLTRTVTRVLLPIAALAAIVLGASGVVQNLSGQRIVTTVEGATQSIPGGPIASQVAIKQLGTNGGGFLNANSAHPFENPTTFTNFLHLVLILAIPFALAFAFGRLAGDRRQGWVVAAAMATLLAVGIGITTWAETSPNPQLTAAGADQVGTSDQSAGSMEGKEVRFGTAGCALYAPITTGTSTGAVDCAHDSMSPAGGGAALFSILLGEVSPGGVGSGLYGMLVFVLLAVFIAGLMVGRTPEYLGKRIQAAEVELVVLYILFVPFAVLVFSAISIVSRFGLEGLLNQGPHGLSEMVYAFASAGNKNGSAFGGLTVTNTWYETTLGLSMLIGRFTLMVPVLAIAGSLGRKQKVPASAGTFPTGTPLFAGLLVGVVVIVVGLTYFPVLALGPLVEHLGL